MFSVTFAVNAPAFAEQFKFFPGGLLVPIDFPDADAFGMPGPVFDKTVYVFRRVAEKQSDFMRETVRLQPADQMLNTQRRTARR